ncbi:hypothetical protein IJG22_02025, partial [Candidatus Saccharibacteria bacterium]|nr:hypothetical protein [Candidatus Saccharibacteria bacterium]
IVAITAVGVGLYFGGNAIYNAGINDGREAMSEEISENVNALGMAVAEKEAFRKELGSALSDIPAELNTEGIDEYIKKLNELIGKVEIEDVKTTLKEYLGKWQAFKETYASENNNEIGEKFNELKITAADTAKNLKSLYDDMIRRAIENL